MPERIETSPLAEILAARIRERGRITFAEYMDACLYHPQYGYYAKTAQQAQRDYITSVDVSPIFGRLLARQFHDMWTILGRPERFRLVEAGAGTGALAKQVLDFAQESLGEFYAALHYIGVERSATRRAAHSVGLQNHISKNRFSVLAELPDEIPCGCIFSNELFDAFPVHRVVRENGEIREVYVTLGGNGLSDEIGPLSRPVLAEYFRAIDISLRDDQAAEICLQACDWIESAASRMQRGFVLTIDYGYEARELYDERHTRGTLLAYERHRASEDFYRAPGEQDLTAHVNFTALDIWGRRGGLTRSGFTSQTNFLLALARHSNFADLELLGASELEQTAANLRFKTLIHPEGMGETFKVLAQHKGIAAPQLAGFEPL